MLIKISKPMVSGEILDRSNHTGVSSTTALTDNAAALGIALPFSTVSQLTATHVSSAVNSIQLHGYHSAFDGGGHIRKRGVSTDPGAIQSADGAWWSYVPVNGREVHVKHFGARFNGVANDTSAINTAISALVAIAGSWNPAPSYMLIFPPGRGMTDGGHVIPSGIKADVVGSGKYSTILYLRNGANTFMFDYRSQYGVIERLNMDGNRSNNTEGGDGLIINGPYIKVEDIFIANFSGDGLAVGKNATAINGKFLNITIRSCRGYGVHIYPETGSTDCQWTDVGVGKSGKSGFNIATGAQKMVNCHAWGNGCEDANDRHGYRHVSGSSMLVGCESETNLGHGHYIGAGIRGIAITGGTIWGNGTNGIYSFSSSHCTISGVSIRENGVLNTSGSSSSSFANIHFESCRYMVVTGNDMYDQGSEFPVPDYSPTPTYPYPGRESGRFTVSRHYVESGNSNDNVIVGNQMPIQHSRGGIAIQNVGTANVYHANKTGEYTIPSQESAATLTVPANVDVTQVTGTTSITSITTSYPGRRITLVFSGATTVVNGNNIKIGSNFTSSAGATLSLVCDGTNWYKT